MDWPSASTPLKRTTYLMNYWKLSFWFSIYKKKIIDHKTEFETSGKFKQLANNLDIELLKESKQFIHVVVSINNGKDFRADPIDS